MQPCNRHGRTYKSVYTANDKKCKQNQKMLKYLFILIVFPTILFGEIENARDLMEKGEFEQAMKELLPAARSGNADAEELIGIMYANKCVYCKCNAW